MRVCRAARAGATEYLSTLPGLVVCGGDILDRVSDVWRLKTMKLPFVSLCTFSTLLV
jgi:hypothetical protein